LTGRQVPDGLRNRYGRIIFQGSYGFPIPLRQPIRAACCQRPKTPCRPALGASIGGHSGPDQFRGESKVTIQALGWGPDGKYLKLSEQYCLGSLLVSIPNPMRRFPNCLLAARTVGNPPARPKSRCDSKRVPQNCWSFPGLSVPTSGHDPLCNGLEWWSASLGPGQKYWNFVKWPFFQKKEAAKTIILHATRAPDYGVFAIQGERGRIQTIFDGYADKPTASDQSILEFTPLKMENL